MRKTRYCGIERVTYPSCDAPDMSFVEHEGEQGCLLGDKIITASLYGADLGVPAHVTYDEDVSDDSSSHDVDMLASPNVDFFDIAEQTGHMVEAFAGNNGETTPPEGE